MTITAPVPSEGRDRGQDKEGCLLSSLCNWFSKVNEYVVTGVLDHYHVPGRNYGMQAV